MTPNPIRVCHLTTVHRQPDTRILIKECASLAEAGFKVFLVAGNAQSIEFEGVSVIGVAIPKVRFFRICFGTLIVTIRAAFLRCEVYHIHDPELLIAALILKVLRRKIIYDAHEDYSQTIRLKYYINPTLRRCLGWVADLLERGAGYFCSAIVCATPKISEKFADVATQVVTVRNYPCLKEFPEDPLAFSMRRYKVCYVGIISLSRCVNQMISVSSTCGVPLQLAGGFATAQTRQTVEANPDWSSVNYHGYLARAQVADLTRNSQIGFILCARLDNYIESLPVKMFEYMAAGVAIIASNFPLWRQYVEDNACGVCVDPEDITEITAALNFLLQNPDKAEQMGRNGRQTILTKYNWSNEARELVALYENLVG